MEKDFDSILDKCLSQVRTGGGDIGSCLSQYPEHADRLRPLLEMATRLWQTSQPQPSPEAVSRGEQLLVERVAEKRSSQTSRQELARATGDRIDRGGGGPGRNPFFPMGWRLRWAGVVAAILVLFMLSGGVVAASNNSMPGEVLYPVKMATEQARLVLTPSEEGKAKLHIAFAERRMEEMAEMSRRGQVEQVAKLAPIVAQHLEEAKQVILAIGESQAAQEMRAKLEESAVQQLAGLEGALQEATEETKPLIAQALETSGESYGAAIEAAIISTPAPLLAGKMGTIKILVTDPPPPQAVDNVTVQVAKIEVHRAGGPDSGWITIVDEPRSFDLMQLVGGKMLDLGGKEVNAGTYTQVRMEITQATVIVGGVEHDAKLPSGRLKFVRPFQVEEDGTTELLLDFDGQKSVHVTGKGRYMLKPVVKLFVPKHASPPEGKGKPEGEEAEELEFEGIIKAIAGDNWTMTIDNADWTVDVSEAEIEGEPAVGLEAEVEGTVVGDTIVASKVEIKEAEGAEVEGAEVEGAGELEFEGIIRVIAGDNWTMTIDNADWTVDVSEAEIEGEPAVGLEAEVEGTVVGDTIVASKVEIKEAEGA
ncbi:MAG: DUF4382 domain-containing protein, partial [Dehalococcoidales bacterium]